MSLIELGMMALTASIFLSVLAIGLSTSSGDLLTLLSRPGLLLRSLLAAYVIMLVVAVVLVKLLHLPTPAAVAIVALALAPMPPVLPNSMIKAGGEAAYARGLLAVAGLVSIVWIPAALHVLAAFFGIDVGVKPAAILSTVMISILVPLVVGSLIARLAPRIATKLETPAAALGGLGMIAAMLSLVIGAWSGLWAQLGGGVLVAIVLFSLCGMLAGHLLGGPEPEDRTVLALASAVRHPGIVAAIGGMAAPNSGVALIALLALIVCTLVTMPYIAWRKRAPASIRTA